VCTELALLTPDKKLIHILATGGTIMSRSPSKGEADVVEKANEILPNISVDGVECRVRPVLSKGSANMIPSDWVTIAEAAKESIDEGVDGIVILHGTDTMQYSGAALSFMITGSPVPVVLTGSMVPMGDPGTDGIGNLYCSVRVAAYADLAEVCLVFSDDPVDEKRKVIIRGTRLKKVHSTSKRAFASINQDPIGYVEGSDITIQNVQAHRSDDRKCTLNTLLNPNVCLIKTNPGLRSDHLSRILEMYDGAVLEGTGIGHLRVDDGVLDTIRTFGKPVALSTQCLNGGERLGTYAMDKKILAIPNLIPVRDMLPEVALVKLMWCLGQDKGDVRERLLSNIADEIQQMSVEGPTRAG
jgi:glutamyl-tRNA(Gln) amidotransferase subunit D